jgi:hypothetical protein
MKIKQATNQGDLLPVKLFAGRKVFRIRPARDIQASTGS